MIYIYDIKTIYHYQQSSNRSILSISITRHALSFKPIADGLDQVGFPSLKTIYIYVPCYLTDCATIDRQRIMRKGVSVYFMAAGYVPRW